MKYLDFEKKIKSELGSAKESVDMTNLLSALDLVDKPRKKSYPLWIVIPVVVLLGTTLVFGAKNFGAVDNKQELVDITSERMQGQNIEELIKESPETNAIDIDDNELQKDLISNKDTDSNEKEKKEISKSKKTQKANLVYSRNDANFSQNESLDVLSTESTKSKTQLNTPNYSIGSRSSKADVISYSDISQNNSASASIDAPLEKQYSRSIDNLSKGKPNLESFATRNLEVAVAKLQNRALKIDPLENDVDGIFSRMKINCPSFNQAYWRLALIPEVGIFAPFKTLESKSTELSPDFVIRDRDEKSLEGINIGLHGMLVRDKLPFYLKAGISYSRISEKLDLEYSYTVQDTVIDIISSTVSGNGDTITHVYGPVISESTIIGANRKHYYLHLFDLPVSVGYTTYVGGFDIGLEAGVKLNVMTRATGNLLVTEADHANVAFEKLFKNRIGVSYFGGLMIGRNFGPLGDFYLAPRFQYYPNDFSNSANNISQRYMTIGINAGVVYKIGK